MNDLWLRRISPELRDEAQRCFEVCDATRFLSLAPNDFGLELVFYNYEALRSKGIYEEALVEAFVSTRVNHHCFPLTTLKFMFQGADRERLRLTGSPLPGKGPFTVYRGVAGKAQARRVRGFSWTGSVPCAAWFARRFAEHGDPAVFQVTVSETDVLVYINARHEDEFIVSIPEGIQPTRVRSIAINALAKVWEQEKAARDAAGQSRG